MSDLDPCIYGTPAEIPEIVRRLAAYAYVTTEDYDRHLNEVYGYTPRRDEVHPDARTDSQRHAVAVWKGVLAVAHFHLVASYQLRAVMRRFRSLDDARDFYVPAAGARLPDRLTRDLGRAVEHHVRAAFERRFDP